MTYSSDFAVPDSVSTPLEPPLFIGLEPALLGAVVVGLLAAALLGWMIGKQGASKPKDAADAIWKAVDDTARNALSARTEKLAGAADDLRRVITARLGKTLAFGGALKKSVGALDEAIAGLIEDPSVKPAAAAPHIDPAPVATADAHKADPSTSTSAASAASAPSVTVVSVYGPAGSPPAQQPTPPTPPQPAAKPAKRPMTPEERNNALRLAIAAFNDFWGAEDERKQDIREVVAELTNPGKAEPQPSGWGFGSPAKPDLSHSR